MALMDSPFAPWQDELAALGPSADFRLDALDPVIVLPENRQAVRLFGAVMHPWRHAGMSGTATGLWYESLESVMRMRQVAEDDRPGLFDQVQIMEGEALRVIRQSAEWIPAPRR